MEIHQVVVSAAPRDAVSNSAMEIRDLLRRAGPSDIFAKNIDPALHGDVMAIHDLTPGGSKHLRPDDVVLFHGSIGDPDVFQIVRHLPCEVVLMYHNISPAAAYRPYDPAFAELLRSGRQELGRMRDRFRGALAPSEFNAAELRSMGFPEVRVSPLIIEFATQVTNSDPALDDELADIEGPLFLFVGQMLPHKRPDLLLQAFHIVATYLVPGAHLAMVGASRLPMYRSRLDSFIQELNLPGLHFPGSVTDAQLASYFRRADVFVTASEHEGFCVPLIEAMMSGVPIVARAAAAVPGTLDGAGLCVGERDGSGVIAEAMVEAFFNGSLRTTLVTRGKERAQDFEPTAARRAFLRNLLEVVA